MKLLELNSNKRLLDEYYRCNSNKDLFSKEELKIIKKQRKEEVKKKREKQKEAIKKHVALKGKKKRNRKPRKQYRKYNVYITSPLWQWRRNKYFQKHKRKCIRCGSCGYVQLHHGKYLRPFDGKESDATLFPLCKACHTEFHNRYGNDQDMMEETKEFINDHSDHL